MKNKKKLEESLKKSFTKIIKENSKKKYAYNQRMEKEKEAKLRKELGLSDFDYDKHPAYDKEHPEHHMPGQKREKPMKEGDPTREPNLGLWEDEDEELFDGEFEPDEAAWDQEGIDSECGQCGWEGNMWDTFGDVSSDEPQRCPKCGAEHSIIDIEEPRMPDNWPNN